MAKRILGIDYGEARTGLAVSDALGFLANGIGNIEERDINRLINKIAEKAQELSVEIIVLGNPVNMNGTLGPQSEYVLEFKKMLEEETKLEVILFDERLTTVEVQKVMISADVSRNKRKKVVDTLAATLILQSYLDSIR